MCTEEEAPAWRYLPSLTHHTCIPGKSAPGPVVLLVVRMQEWDSFSDIGFCRIVDFQKCFISL